MGTLFVAGVYGVGKSTLCAQLSAALQIPFFSAGDLISKVNGEQYGANKAVTNKFSNQNILAAEVQKQLEVHSHIILAGHFCIFNKDNQVDRLPEEIFQKLKITKILLLEADTEKLLSNLSARDKREYTYQQILELQQAEQAMAQRVSEQIGCDLLSYFMKFDGTDFDKSLSVIKKGGW